MEEVKEAGDSENQKDLVPAKVKITEHVDGGYAWVVIFATFLFLFSTWGVNSAFGIYFSRYQEANKFPGASRIDYAFVGGISFGVGIFFGPVVNYIHGLIGTHLCILLGCCFQFTAIMLASWAVSLWQLYCSQGLMQSFGLAFISLPAMTVAPQWFVKKRVFAQGLAVTGSGAGGLFFTLSMYKIMEVRSVQWALRAQAIISASLVVIGVCLMRVRKKATIFNPFDIATLRCAGFWLLCFFNVTCMFGYVILLYTMSEFTTALGYTEWQGAIVSAMVQVGFTYGRPLTGFISDKVGAVTVTIVCYYMSTIFTLAMWIPTKNYATCIALALLVGTFIGCIFPTTAPITARLVGLPKLNVGFCMLWIFVGIASIFSEPIGASILSELPSGKLDPALFKNTAIFAGCSFFACATSMVIMRGYITAKDKIIESSEVNEDDIEVLDLTVPFKDVFLNIFAWNAKRV